MLVRHEVERAPKNAPDRERDGDATQQTCSSRHVRAANGLAQDVSGRGPQRKADPEFLRSLLNEISDRAENSDGNENERHNSEAAHKNQIEL